MTVGVQTVNGDDRVLKIQGVNSACATVLTLNEAKELRRWLNDHYRELRPSKDWANCPYEGHCDDCDCRGEGGDR